MSEEIETINFEPGKKHYMSWPVIALIDFVTIISFENIFYPFQNQGLSVVVSWIFLLFAYGSYVQSNGINVYRSGRRFSIMGTSFI